MIVVQKHSSRHREGFKPLKFAFLIFVSVGLIFAEKHLPLMSSARSVIELPLAPFEMLPTKIRDISSWMRTLGFFQSDLLEKNSTLVAHNRMLLARLQRMTALEQENESLRELLGVTEKIKAERFVIGEVNAVSLDPFRRMVSINLGQADGIYVGQPIVESSGIIGQVAHVGRIHSKIVLINSANNAVPIANSRNGVRGILFGTGDQMELRHVSRHDEMHVDDVLVTSGLGGIYPPGYPVAVVTKVDFSTERFAKISAAPLTDLDKIRYVLLIWVQRE